MRNETIPQRVIARALEERVARSSDGCLLSTYSPCTPRGYRQIGWREDDEDHKELVHRVAWFAKHGPIPANLTVHHKCFQTACVNIEHLGLMERYENTRRQNGEDWELGTCKRGHPDTELVQESGQRVCRLCRKASVDRRRKERNASAHTK